MWILPKNLHTLGYVPGTEALSLDLNESSKLCAQSLFVRSKPLPARTWLQKWKRDSWTQHLFGRILKHSLGQSFVTAWTSSLEVIPANHSAQQDNAEEQMTQGTFGRGLPMESERCAPEFAFLKTSKDTLRWDSPLSSVIWKRWVIEQRGEYSQRRNASMQVDAQHRTSASECSSWPSPVASEVRQGFQDRSRGMKGSQESLTTMVLKTSGPAAQESPSTHGSRPESWATPRAEHDSGGHRGKKDTLHSQMKAWATPQTRDAKGAEGRMIRDGKCSDLPSQTEVDQTGKWNRDNGKLNPRWVETLMGIPVGWTMPSCLQVIANPANFAESQSVHDATNTTLNAHALGQIATMTDNRTDELRLLGNGVVPAVAAKAFKTLLQRFL